MRGQWTRFAKDYRHEKRRRGRASRDDGDGSNREGCECRRGRRT